MTKTQFPHQLALSVCGCRALFTIRKPSIPPIASGGSKLEGWRSIHDQPGSKTAIILFRKGWLSDDNKAAVHPTFQAQGPSDPAPPACRHRGASVVTVRDAVANRRKTRPCQPKSPPTLNLYARLPPHSTRRARLNLHPI